MVYHFLPHTADVKILVHSTNLTGCFKEAANALKESICGDLEAAKKEKKKIVVEGKDNEALLYNFLEEFLFLLDAEDFLLSEVEDIRISDNKLEAVAIGDKASNYDFNNKVKAITYNEMFIKNERNKYICQFVLDV